MTLPLSKFISLNLIRQELGLSDPNFSLDTAENGQYVAINPCSPYKPALANPTSLSEWYGYNHNAKCTSTQFSATISDIGESGSCNQTFNPVEARQNLTITFKNTVYKVGTNPEVNRLLFTNIEKFPSIRIEIKAVVYGTLRVVYGFEGDGATYTGWDLIPNVAGLGEGDMVKANNPYYVTIWYGDGSGRVTSNMRAILVNPNADGYFTTPVYYSPTLGSVCSVTSLNAEEETFDAPIGVGSSLIYGDHIPADGYYRMSVDPTTVYTAKGVVRTFTPTATTDSAAPITSWCLVDPTNSASCTAGPFTVANVGTWLINGANGLITFTPVSTFVGTATIGSKATNSVGSSAAATQTVIVVAPPTVTGASATVGQGQSGNLTPTATPANGTNINFASACVVDPADSVCKTSITVAGVGTYVVNTSSGAVTFTADANATPGVKPAVLYRISDALGQVGGSTLNTTVTAPAPTITGNTASTVTTTPVTLSPASVTGTGLTNCIIDPANNNCGSTVTLPGVGTFVLNGNGSVTFTAVSGYVGIAAVDYQVTDGVTTVAASLTVTVNPVTVPNNPTPPPAPQITPTTGTGPNNQPVVLNPVVTPVTPAPGLCLIDPVNQHCKTVVVIKGQGTWTLNPNGSVTFVPLPNWFGTSKVVLHAWDGYGQTDDETLTVTIVPSAKRPPRTITIGNFIDGSPVITKQIAASIKAFVTKYSDYKNLECVGYTEGPTVLATDAALSKKRAINGCAFVKAGLGKKLVVKKISAGQDKVEADSYRRITITLND